MSRRHIALLALAGLVALAACGGGGDLPSVPLGSDTPTADGGSPTGSEASEGTAPSASDGGTEGSEGPGGPGVSPEPSATDTTTPVVHTPANDGGGVGGNGPAMLRGDRARIVIEIDVQEGLSVTQSAVDHLANEISRHVDKPGGVAFAGANTFASSQTEWTTDAMRSVVAGNRSTHTTDDEVSVHLLYLRGGFYSDGEETSAIGVAYSASTIAVFPERWSGLTTALLGGSAIERAVLVHEFGHLFGLINLTYTSDIAHEDPDHPGHSNSQDSVMYWAIETDLIGQVFSGGPPDRFDQDDAADLAGLKSGRYA